MVMCLFTTSAFAQEVRGVETRFVKNGETLYLSASKEDAYNVEFTNRNSITVSVTVELWQAAVEARGYFSAKPEKLVATKEIVLDPGESYIWDLGRNYFFSDGKLYNSIWEVFYVKYKAYKLQ